VVKDASGLNVIGEVAIVSANKEPRICNPLQATVSELPLSSSRERGFITPRPLQSCAGTNHWALTLHDDKRENKQLHKCFKLSALTLLSLN